MTKEEMIQKIQKDGYRHFYDLILPGLRGLAYTWDDGNTVHHENKEGVVQAVMTLLNFLMDEVGGT